MKELEVDEPLKILDRHQPMPLYINSDGETINAAILIRDFSKYLIKKYSRNTAKNYKNRVMIMFKKINSEKPRITVKIIREFLENKTITYHAAIKVFMKYVEKKFNIRFIDIDYPDVKKYEEKAVLALTSNQINKLINKMPSDLKFFTKFVYMCGLRISEPYGIMVDDINWDQWNENRNRHGLILIKNTKSKRQRQIPINPYFMEEVYSYLKKNNDKIILKSFIFDYNREYYYKRKIRKLRKKKRIADNLDSYIYDCFVVYKKRQYLDRFKIICKSLFGREYTPHILRKSRATSMLKSGVPLIEVSKFLGHADVKTTMKYLASDINDLSNSMAKLGL